MPDDKCPSCEEAMINGVRCHEIGCPDAWRTEVRNCKECGCAFTPGRPHEELCSQDCSIVHNA